MARSAALPVGSVPLIGRVVLLLPMLIAWAGAARAALPKYCDQYKALYTSAELDMSLFKAAGGITPDLFWQTMRTHTAGNRDKGLAVAIYEGRVYVISNTKSMDLKRFGHHVTLWVNYLIVLLDLEERFGAGLEAVGGWEPPAHPTGSRTRPKGKPIEPGTSAGEWLRGQAARARGGGAAGTGGGADAGAGAPQPGILPNVELVFHTIDRPVRLTNWTNRPEGSLADKGAEPGFNYPVLRFGKSPAHPDILVPNFHFNMHRYQTLFLDRIDAINAAVPWGEREQVLFSRFTAYPRYVHPNDTFTQRVGLGGEPLCKVQGRSTSMCNTRIYLHDWARKHKDKLDFNKDGHVTMAKHAEFRYLLHVDGQGLSSKLELLLTFGSLVMKEESGYMAYYHHLLRAHEHFLPVWRQGGGPEDMLEGVDWARGHDDEARKMGKNAQDFARKYLSREARTCFWLRLLEEYGKTMTYDPVQYRNISVRHGTSRLPYMKPARQWLAEEVAAFNPHLLESFAWQV